MGCSDAIESRGSSRSFDRGWPEPCLFLLFFQEKNRSDPSLRAAADALEGKSAVGRDHESTRHCVPKNFSHRDAEVGYANITIMPILSISGDVERDLIRTRTTEGRSRAKAQGPQMGRPPATLPGAAERG